MEVEGFRVRCDVYGESFSGTAVCIEEVGVRVMDIPTSGRVEYSQ